MMTRASVGVGAETAAAVGPADSTAVRTAPVDSVPQRDVMDIVGQIIGRTPTTTDISPRPGLSITLLPSLGYNPAYGAYFGASAAVGGWLGDPATTTASSGSVGATYSTTGQISVQFKSDFYLPRNRWALKGDWRYLDTSQPTYGLGPVTEPDEYPMDFKLYRISQTLYRRVSGEVALYAGVGYHLDVWDKIVDPRAAAGEDTPYTLYSGHDPTQEIASGLLFSALYDSRDNPINARRGLYWIGTIRAFPRGLGSDRNWQGLWSDMRSYSRVPGGSRNTLAFWSYLWFTFGDAPYLDLPSIGWDTYSRSGRGYPQGRIRAVHIVYTEAEYRAVLTRDGLLGAVAFVNLTFTSLPGLDYFGPPDPGGGVGLRLKFGKRTDTNLTVDYGWGSARSNGVYFGMQEAF